MNLHHTYSYSVFPSEKDVLVLEILSLQCCWMYFNVLIYFFITISYFTYEPDSQMY